MDDVYAHFSDCDYFIRMILIGSAGVGKSCLLRSLMGKDFCAQPSTIGVDFEMRQITVGSQNIALQVWDTGGQERFHTITTSYYRKADAALIVFDICSSKSFRDIKSWLEEVRLHARRSVYVILIGNKSDSEDKRRIPYDEARDFAHGNGLEYLETSCQSGQNVQEACRLVVNSCLELKLMRQRSESVVKVDNDDALDDDESTSSRYRGNCCY